MGRSLFHGQNPWFTDQVYAPYGSPLVWHSLAPLQSSSVALLDLVMPTLVAYNVVVMLAFPLAGACAFL
jgi:hypothetical protein